MPSPLPTWTSIVILLVVLTLPGCGEGPQYVSMGTAPVGGTFPVIGGAMAEVLNDFRGDNDWKIQVKGTKGSQENIRRLAKGQLQLGLANSAISYFARVGGDDWEGTYEVRSVATLVPLTGVFVTKAGSPIERLADLKGKRVVIGPAGAGFQMFIRPILEAHGVPWDSFTPLYDPGAVAVDRLGDGAADAVFFGGPPGRHPSITQAIGSYDVKFIAYDDAVRKSLVKKYPFFALSEIPAKDGEGKPMYKGLDEPFPAMIVGNLQLVTHKDTDRELIRRVTRILFEQRDEFAKKHPAGKAMNPKNCANYKGIPFHEGAIDFYKTQKGVRPGAWNAPEG